MKGLITLVLATQLVAVAAVAQSTTPPGSAVGSSSPTSTAPVNAAPQSSSIRILTPVANQQVTGTNAVSVRFEVVNPSSSAGTPNFLVQLDGNDPIRTSSMEQSFTGLAPGAHSVTVQLVDANNTPISGSRAIVQFVVAGQQTAPARTSTPGGTASVTDDDLVAPDVRQVGGPKPPEVLLADNAPLPSASSALPLISVIGFGVLVGGVASAMKTR